MTMNIALTVIAALTAAAYLIYAIIKNKGVPDSVSATAYAVKHKWMFTVGLMTEAALLFPALLEKSADNTQFLAFLTAVGLGMVGTTPNYRNEGKTEHYIGAFLTAGASQGLVALNSPTILSTWAAFPLIALLAKKDYTFWAEIICLVNMFLYCIL